MVCDCGLTWTDWATFVASAGTVILAGVAWYQATQAKSQIELGRGQLASAQESSKAAADVHRESIRARVDQFAPRVSVNYGVVSGPYHSSSKLDHHQRIYNPDPIWEKSAEGMKFILPKDGDGYLWFEGRALIVNDGPTPARVRLPDEATFVADHSETTGEEIPIPPFRKFGIHDEAVLAPGKQAQFRWSAGKPVSDWANAAKVPGEPHPGGSIWLWITVFDDRQDGVIDTLMAHLKPKILAAEQGSTDVWRLTSSKKHEMAIQPTRRGYRNEGASTEDTSQMNEYHDAYESDSSAINEEDPGGGPAHATSAVYDSRMPKAIYNACKAICSAIKDTPKGSWIMLGVLVLVALIVGLALRGASDNDKPVVEIVCASVALLGACFAAVGASNKFATHSAANAATAKAEGGDPVAVADLHRRAKARDTFSMLGWAFVLIGVGSALVNQI